MPSVSKSRYYLALADDLAAAPYGERGGMAERAASFCGVSVKTLYRNLKKIAGYSGERQTRKDAGTRATPRELALLVGGIVRKATLY